MHLGIIMLNAKMITYYIIHIALYLLASKLLWNVMAKIFI